MINATQIGLAMDNPITDLYLLQGVAQCNLRDYESAEASYTQLIEVMPDYTLVYALRAEARQKQGNMVGALADVAMILQNPLAGELMPLMLAFQSGEVNCENFFDVDLEALMGEAVPGATESP